MATRKVQTGADLAPGAPPLAAVQIASASDHSVTPQIKYSIRLRCETEYWQPGGH